MPSSCESTCTTPVSASRCPGSRASPRPPPSWQTGPVCVLLDLGLPDSVGFEGLRHVLRLAPDAAVLVLTGASDASLGIAAMTAGAQDYLVKGQVDGATLSRCIRYAIERKRANESARKLREAAIRQDEYARLERGLLPVPILDDASLLSLTALPAGPGSGAAGRRLLRPGPDQRWHAARSDRRRLRSRTRRGGAGRLPARRLADAGAVRARPQPHAELPAGGADPRAAPARGVRYCCHAEHRRGHGQRRHAHRGPPAARPARAGAVRCWATDARGRHSACSTRTGRKFPCRLASSGP